jgi:FAD/FMN-containing dehydrogenase
MATASDFNSRLRAIVGDAGVITSAQDMAPYLCDWRGNLAGAARCVVRPAGSVEVAQVVKLCAQDRIPIVPQGGNTGLVGGSVPDSTGDAVVLSLKRMNRIRAVDTANDTLIAEAGCILMDIQQAANDHDRLFPLRLAAEGSCTIGGNLSTNAGGTAVLRYGNTRELVLGLEAVLPSGEIWNGLRGLRKDNTGYDLKQLFIGAEGTLGIVTAIVLKLFPKPKSSCTALVAVPDPAAAVALLAHVRGALGDRLTGFELMSRLCLEHVIRHFPATIEPFSRGHPWQVLVELADTMINAGLEDRLAGVLEQAIENNLALDAVVASSVSQSRALWNIREHIPEAEKLEGKSVKHDVSVPISRIADFIARCDPALQSAFPAAKIICFGHVGDGNLHYNLAFPGAAPTAEQSSAANRIVYGLLDELGGSISAEHGLGQLKREEITRHKSAVEMEMMRSIKRMLDPHNIMNPGKVV